MTRHGVLSLSVLLNLLVVSNGHGEGAGSSLVFLSIRGDRAEYTLDLLAADTAGKGLRKVDSGDMVPPPGRYGWPYPSPDGSRTIDVAVNADQLWDLYVADADGGSRIALGVPGSAPACAHWSPDGTRIAFSSGPVDNRQIYVAAADGSDQVRLSSGTSDEFNPYWSPDASRIVFTSNRPGNLEVCAMRPDGSNWTNLTQDPADDSLPRWSPQGPWSPVSDEMVFISNRHHNHDIFVMQSDGSGQLQVSHSPVPALSPVWSPDGTMIAYVANFMDGESLRIYGDIFLAQADGTGEIRVTDTPDANDQNPFWADLARSSTAMRSHSWAVIKAIVHAGQRGIR